MVSLVLAVTLLIVYQENQNLTLENSQLQGKNETLVEKNGKLTEDNETLTNENKEYQDLIEMYKKIMKDNNFEFPPDIIDEPEELGSE